MVWHRRWRWAVGAAAPAPSRSALAPPSARQMARNSVRASSTGRSWSTVRSSSPSAVARSKPDRMWATPVAPCSRPTRRLTGVISRWSSATRGARTNISRQRVSNRRAAAWPVGP
ncbi:hypothetical protein D3C86_1735650 [compost metagenome]